MLLLNVVVVGLQKVTQRVRFLVVAKVISK